MIHRQNKIFFQIVNAIIICSILITVLVSSIILVNSMFNVTAEAKEKIQYLINDYGHQIDIRLSTNETIVNDLNRFLKTAVDWGLYKNDADSKNQTHILLSKLLASTKEDKEYVYDYFIYFKNSPSNQFITSEETKDSDSNIKLASILNKVQITPSSNRGIWLDFDEGEGLFCYIEPLYIDNQFLGYVGGRYRQNAFLWGLYDSQNLFFSDLILLDSASHSMNLNHNLKGLPLHISSEILNKVESTSKNVFEIKNKDDHDIFVSFSRLKNNWTILIGIDKVHVLSRSYELVKMLIMLLIIGIVFSIFIASSISERIVEPIDVILKEIKRISKGDLKEPIPEKYKQYKNEIGTLATTFDAMRISIKNYISEINNHSQHLENEVFYQTAELIATNDKLQETIEEMKSKDHTITQANIELEETLENLRETQTELVKSQKLAALSSLVRGVSHKLNTPVGTSITTLSYLIQEMRSFFAQINNNFKLENPYHEEMYDLIDIANATMTNLISTRDILDTLKDITSDSMTEKKHNFNLTQMVKELISVLKNRPEARNYEIDLNIDSEISIYSYPSVFAQVISNLVSNSIIHGFKNRSIGHINLSIFKKDNYIEMIYIDDGVGIDPHSMDKIFDPFYTTNLASKTSGLGLSIIYNQINNKLNGTIMCDSHYQNGTRFKIRIPLT